MKKIIIMFISLILVGAFLNGAIPQDCKTKLAETYAKGKFLKLKADGVPTMIEKLPGDLGSKSSTWIVVKKDGEWKVKSILGTRSDSTNVLSKGDLLMISSIKVKKKNIILMTRTDKAMPYDAAGRESWLGSKKAKGTGPHANMWDIKVDKSWGCEEITAQFEKLFDVFDSRADLDKPKEISLGMTIEEVEELMGQPKKKASLGSKIKYKYDDMVITFEDGKVVDVDF